MNPATLDRLAERETPAGLASTLSWTATGALIWLRKLERDELTAAEYAEYVGKLRDWPARLRACAAHIETFCTGDDAP